MSDSRLLGPWIRRFLLERLKRNLSPNTQRSYRDAVALLMPFVSKKLRRPVDQLAMTDLNAELVRSFLADLEITRNCGITTRNQRLAAIHALAQFVGMHSPEHIAWSGQIRGVPFKKTGKRPVPYLEKPEMDALLNAPDQSTTQGRRDHLLLLFLYNSGARADEAAQLRIADLELGLSDRDYSSVRIRGKGNKIRLCPLWSLTVKQLKAITAGRAPTERVLNRRGQPLTRFGLHAGVK